jgi:putative effector of murein hydrolase
VFNPVSVNLTHYRSLLGMALGLFAGSMVSMLSGVVLVRLFCGERSVALSMLRKAATTPIAMGGRRTDRGKPGMTASLAVFGGIIGAIRQRLTLCEFAIGARAGWWPGMGEARLPPSPQL